MFKNSITKIAKLTTGVIIVVCNGVFGQGQSNGTAELTSILLPSPTASELGKYGGIPVGLSTGAPNITIPLYNFQLKGISVPISINYSSNGLKVDQVAGRAGQDWLLNAGGVITRTVYGAPDDLGQRLTAPGNFGTPSQEVLNYLRSASTGTDTYDTQYDVYSFNFGDYRGRFIIDQGRVHPFLHEGLKFELDKDGYRFKVTVPNGTVYYFGGTGAVETTQRRLSGPNCGRAYDRQAATAWYLQRIVTGKGGQVDFKYLPCNYSIPLGLSQSMIRFAYSPQFDCFGVPAGGAAYNDRLCQNSLSVQGVYLDEITGAGSGKMKFTYTRRNDVFGDVLVSSISLFGPQNLVTPMKTFHFDYLYSNSTSYSNSFTTAEMRVRPFLTGLREISGALEKKHSFNYNNINGLPPRLSFSQDVLGYFNGKSNQSLIAKPSDSYVQSVFPLARADRTPVESFARLGMLSRVTYPTGAVDSLTYEGNTEYVKEYIDPPESLFEARVRGTGIRDRETFVSGPITVPTAQTIRLQASAYFDGEHFDGLHHIGTIKLYNSTTGRYEFNTVTLRVGTPFSRDIQLRAGESYILTITANGSGTACYAAFSYKTGPPTERYVNRQTGGLRLLSVRSLDPVTSTSSIKKYFYSRPANAEASSGHVLYRPLYEKHFSTRVECLPDRPGEGDFLCFLSTFRYIMLSSNSMVNLYPYNGSHTYYSSVVESDGEDFENGGVAYSYHIASDMEGRILVGLNGVNDAPYSKTGWMNGLEIFRKYFTKVNGAIVPVKEINRTYKTDGRVSGEFLNYVVRRNYTRPCWGTPVTWEDLEPFDAQQYSVFSKWVYMDSQTEIVYDREGKNPVKSLTVYNYDNPSHKQPTRIETSKSDGSKEVTATTYPDDYAAGTPFIDNMKTNHLIAYPIEQVKYREVSAARTILSGMIKKYLPGGKGLVDQVLELETARPIAQSTFKFSNTFKGQLPIGTGTGPFAPDATYTVKLTYSDYDAYGNPQQVTPALGAPVAYIWSYGGQYPVAEIRHATSAWVRNAMGGDVALRSFTASSPAAADLRSRFNAWRPSLPGSQLSYYTYEPLNGMTSATDPSGRTTFYNYDGFGRLKEVKDTQSRTTDTYDYHYRP